MRPFLGAYKDAELREFKNKSCGFCKHKGLIAHIEKRNPFPGIIPDGAEYIGTYWCPNCNKTLLPSETEGEPME